MSWLVGVAGLAGLPGLAVPAAIRALPEPPAEALPESAEDDTAVQRMLRAEGTKPPYRDVAALPRLGPWAAALGVVLDVAIGLRLGNHPVTWVISLLVPVLVLLAVVDWRTRLLPRVVVLPATGVLLALLVLEWLVTGEDPVLVRAVAGMLLARTFFWLLWFVRRAGMGFGDVRLAALLGLVLARLGWTPWFIGLYAALLLFAGFGIGLAVVRRDRATLKRAYPFGPFMIGGALLGVLLGGSVHLGG